MGKIGRYLGRILRGVRQSPLIRQIERRLRFGGTMYVSVGDTNSGFFRAGWQTVDLHDADFICDIRKNALPFDDNSVDIINCSHVVEHLPYPEESSFFYAEACRVLKPGGLLRISTPDADLLVDKYRAEDWRYFLAANGSGILHHVVHDGLAPEVLLLHNCLVGWFASYSGRLDTGGGPVVTKTEVDDALASMNLHEFGQWCVSRLEPNRIYAHVNLYTYARLVKELEAAGFTNFTRSEFGVSSASPIVQQRLDNPKRQMYSMYVDVKK